MLTDEEADAIRRQLDSGIRGPILLRWIRALLDDRDERVGRRPTPDRPYEGSREPADSRSGMSHASFRYGDGDSSPDSPTHPGPRTTLPGFAPV